MADTDDIVSLVLGAKPEEAKVGQGRGSALCSYWKRPDGWITVIEAHVKTNAPNYAEFVQKGFRPLSTRFGEEVAFAANATMMSNDGTRAFEKFLAAGGLDYIDTRGEYGPAGEYLMPPDQLIAYGWHRNPAVVAKRPDVANVKDYECPHRCVDRTTGKITVFSSQGLLDRHLDSDPDHRAVRTQHAMTETLTKVLAPQAVAPAIDMDALVASITAKVTAELEAKYAAPTPPTPAARYPEGSPDESWPRTALMAWAKDNNLSHVLSPSMNTADTFAAIQQARLVSAGG